MKNRFILVCTFIVLCIKIFAQQAYLYEVDVSKTENDQLKIFLKCPKINQKQIHFYFPAYIPNNHTAVNYGRFVSKFSVKNAKGQYLNFTQKDLNTYFIPNAQEIHTIEYVIDDTWDFIEDKNYVFGASGTNIEQDCILLNAGGAFGYFENYQNIPFHIRIIHPNQWYAYASLFVQEKKENQTVFLAPNYNRLVDNPIIATQKKDTLLVKQDKMECTVSVYASFKYPKDSIRGIVSRTMKNVQNYLQYPFGKPYHLILYLRNRNEQNKHLRDIGAFGSTEHMQCSVIHIPEDMEEYHPLKTPYLKRIEQLLAYNFIYATFNGNLPSAYYTDFNFQKPISTAHNWFYTSFPHYISMLMSNYNNLHKLCSWMSKKASMAKTYPEGVPLNNLSLHITDYPNPYDMLNYFFDYGVLLMFCLDIEIIMQSKGEKNLLEVIKSLNKKFDKERPFNENELIPAIVEQSFPQISKFFELYFEKANKPDYAKYAQQVGLKYEEGIFIPLDTQTLQQQQYLKKWLYTP